MSENPSTRPLISISSNAPRQEGEIDLSSALQPILNLTSILSLTAYLWIAFLNALNRQVLVPLLIAPLLAVILMITFRRNLSAPLRVSLLVTYFLLIGVVVSLLWGVQSIGLFLLLIAVQITFTFWNEKAGRLIFFISLGLIVAVAITMHFGVLQPLGLNPQPILLSSFGATVASFVLANWVLTVISSHLIQSYTKAASSERELARILEEERKNLEARIEERTRLLTRQTSLMETAGEIAHQISMETDQENLFRNTIQLIRDRLGYYHAGIFLMDEANEYAVLVSALGEAGEKMLAQGHRLKKGEEGIVGNVVARGEARIALDVGKDAVHFKNPLLPLTRSEIALPIKIGERVLGALDIQSTEPEAFTQVDIQSLQIIANQLAVALERIRLIDQLQQTVADLESGYRTETRKSWRTYIRSSRQTRGFRYDPNRKSLEPILSVNRIQPNQSDPQSIQVPLRSRGEVVGMLNIKFKSGQPSPEIQRLLKTTAERLGSALETARLLEELQLRAEREHLVSDLATQVRSSTDFEQILKTTALQIRQKLGLKEVVVQILPPDETQNGDYPGEVS
ncbi:MAG: GAF domain-containing protein [Bellilinea sp.]|nr:GAF domain-containing protein [Bellilinea sp.]